MRRGTKVIIAVLLLLLPIAWRWVWFHRGVYTPLAIPEMDDRQLEVSLPEYSPVVDQPVAGAGRVVLDVAHNNNLEVDDLTPLQDRLRARGATIENYDGYTSALDTQLRGAIAYLVVAPTYLFAEEEASAVVDFVEAGGRVLLIADPTRPVPVPAEEQDTLDLAEVFFPESAIPAMNSLAGPLGVVYFDDYLYNQVENEGNYRNVKLTVANADHPLTEGLETVVFFASHSLRSDGPTLLQGDENTFSAKRTGESDLAAGVLSADGGVLALGDLTALTAPYHTVGDNDRFLSNVADWLMAAPREWDLRDFPYLFQRPVDLVQISGEYLDPRLVAKSGPLREVLALTGLTLEMRDAADPDHDAILVGTFDDVEPVQEYLGDAGVTITIIEEQEGTPTPTPTSEEEEQPRDSIEVEGLGSIPLQDTLLFVVHRTARGVSLVVLGQDGDAAMDALDLLMWADFVSCVDRDDVTVCSTGEGEEGLGLDERPREEEQRATPSPEEEQASQPRIGSALESEAAMAAGAPWLEELAEESYDDTSEAGETYLYTVDLESSRDVLWVYGWCTTSQDILEQNWEHIALIFTLNGEEVPFSEFALLETDFEGQFCRLHYALVTDWPRGEHELLTEVTFDTELNDGQDTFPEGTHYYKYVVTVGG
jgi:hypothetical protein